MNTRVRSFSEVSLAARAALGAAGYLHIGDLEGVTDEDLLKIKNVGVGTLEHIRKRLEEWRIEGQPAASASNESADVADASVDYAPADRRIKVSEMLLREFVGKDGYKASPDFVDTAWQLADAHQGKINERFGAGA